MLSHVSQKNGSTGRPARLGRYFRAAMTSTAESSPAIRLSCLSISATTKTPSARPERSDGLQNQRPA